MFIIAFQAFLSNEDLGDSLDSVEALIKKHEDFEKSLAAQEEKIRVCNYNAICLIITAHKLCCLGHFIHSLKRMIDLSCFLVKYLFK